MDDEAEKLSDRARFIIFLVYSVGAYVFLYLAARRIRLKGTMKDQVSSVTSGAQD
jgi:hypothetical protein